MFVYEKKNSINITFTENKPVETPDIIVKGYQNGAAVIVGDQTFGVKDGVEFEKTAKTLVYQKDSKMMITFQGVAGMEAPDVVLDETAKGTVEVVVGDDTVVLNFESGNVEIVTGEPTGETPEKEPEKPVEDDKQSETDLPDKVEGEGDSDATVEDL